MTVVTGRSEAAARDVAAIENGSGVLRAETGMRDPLPKTNDGRGSVHVEFRRCGKANCRCSRGLPHGPYYVRRWREHGRQRKLLVPREELREVLLAIEERRALGSASAMVNSLRSVGP